MATGIDLRGGEQVMAAFDLHGTPFFAIYQGKDLKFYHDAEDIDGARELLQQHVDMLNHGQSTAPFKIVFYTQLNSAGKLTNDNIKGSNTFRICTPGVSYNNPNFGNPEFIGSYSDKRERISVIEQQNAKISELTEKLDLLLEQKAIEDEETEAEATAGVGSFQNIIGAVLSNPTVQNVLIGKLLAFVDQVLPDKQQAPAAQIAGVLDETEVQGALRTLFAAGMTIADLQKLAQMSENEPAMFNFLLSQLRNK